MLVIFINLLYVNIVFLMLYVFSFCIFSSWFRVLFLFSVFVISCWNIDICLFFGVIDIVVSFFFREEIFLLMDCLFVGVLKICFFFKKIWILFWGVLNRLIKVLMIFLLDFEKRFRGEYLLIVFVCLYVCR